MSFHETAIDLLYLMNSFLLMSDFLSCRISVEDLCKWDNAVHSISIGKLNRKIFVAGAKRVSISISVGKMSEACEKCASLQVYVKCLCNVHLELAVFGLIYLCN